MLSISRIAASTGALALATTLVSLPPASQSAQAATPNCSTNVSHDIDAYGQSTLIPRVTCTASSARLTITTFHATTGAQTIIHDNITPGTYSGYGVTLPYTGPGQYCITTDVVWIWDDTQTVNCVTR
jgi:hypothetical protein